jgi:hypothetical protein
VGYDFAALSFRPLSLGEQRKWTPAFLWTGKKKWEKDLFGRAKKWATNNQSYKTTRTLKG